MNDYIFEKAIAAGLLFGASASAGKDLYRKGKKFFRIIKKRYKKAKELDIPNFKKSVDETMEYVNFYLSEDYK